MSGIHVEMKIYTTVLRLETTEMPISLQDLKVIPFRH